MLRMTTKDLNVAISKREDSIGYLMAKYQYSEKEELFDAIRKVTPHADDFISRLEKKERRGGKKKSKDLKHDEVVSVEQEIITTLPVEQDICEEVYSISAEQKLEKLQEDERELRNALYNNEIEHKKCMSDRHDILKKVELTKKALDEMQRLIKANKERIASLFNEYENLADQMVRLNEDKHVYEQLLEEVRTEIAELSKVSIFVYDDGTIEVINAEMPELEQESINATFNNLILIPQAEECTIKELKTIAKLKLMVEGYKENNCPFEYEFDSTRVQNVFETVIA